ncbi:MAG: polyhydroxyalkanoate depolymerase [Candidatus Latescibacteria bacterium]|nr:polyhydroxyalkanoate depolymerase [Candidatus Latescibacterota bacterium]
MSDAKNDQPNRYTLGLTGAQQPTEANSTYPWPADRIEEYTAFRIDEPIAVDGHLDEPAWQRAKRSPRFADMISGARAVHDTRAAVLWDKTHLYVGFWVEEPNLQADLTERDAPIYRNNDVELFIAGRDSYYEFEINALGTIYEVFFIWDGDYDKVDYTVEPTLRKEHPQAEPFNGVGFKKHPRGMRTGYWGYDFPGLQSAVQLDGTLNDSSDRDRGWTVELALPWSGMDWLVAADGRQLPPGEGDIWRMDFSRFNQYREAPPAEDSAGWMWSPHGERDSHIPECFPIIRFTEDLLPQDR